MPLSGLEEGSEHCSVPTQFYIWGLQGGGLHICGEQAGLTAVLRFFTHPHTAGLIRKHLLTHHGPLALSGVAPAVSEGGESMRIHQASCLLPSK